MLSFARKYKKQLLDTGLDSLKTDSKKIVYKTGKFLGNKIANSITRLYGDKIVKTKPAVDESSRDVEETIIPPEKRRKNIRRIKTVIKMEHYKIFKLLNDSTVSKFGTKKWIKINDL